MAAIYCTKCGAYLIEYDREDIGDDTLVKFRHTDEQHTECDGYAQVRESEFEQHGVEQQ